MKLRCTVAAVFGLGYLAVPAAGMAQSSDSVMVTKHNLSVLAGSRADIKDWGEVCVYCHTPHAGSKNSAPLWNKDTTTSVFTMYSSPTIQMTIGGKPTGVSLACLTCHDGSLGLDAIINKPNAKSGEAALGGLMNANDPTNQKFQLIGTDLTDDHPIGVTYDPAVDTMFRAKASVTGAGLVLYGASANQVECGTCHNPHTRVNEPFLRKTNGNSALCLTCHKK